MFRNLALIITVIGAYSFLRGWIGGESLMIRSCFAIAILVMGLAFWGIHRGAKHPRMKSLRRPRWIDFLSLGIAVIFTEACFVVLTSTLVAPSQAVVTSFQRMIIHDEESDSEEGINFGGEGSGDWLFKPTLERVLPKRSNHKLGNKLEVFVVFENEGNAARLRDSRIHLRSFSFSRFDGAAWSANPMRRVEVRAPIEFAKAKNRTLEPAMEYRVFHSANPTGQNMFTALSGVTSTDLAQLTQLSDAIFQLPDLAHDMKGYQYGASSSPVHFTDLSDKVVTAGSAVPSTLELPPSFAERLQGTAGAFKDQPDLTSQLVALRRYLQNNYEYSLKTANLRDANALENFLYVEKRGYCEHFATAAALLVRTLGVPSRISYGWSGGRYFKAQNMFVFRAKDAHAWTEIKLDGYGWVVFDTTPPDDDAIPETHTAPDNEQAPDPQDVIAEQYEQLEKKKAQRQSSFSIIPSQWAIITLGVMAVVSIAFLVMRFLARPATDSVGMPLKVLPPAYLVYFKQTCATVGYPMPDGRTLRQHVDLLHQHNVTPDFLDELLAYHYGLLYGGVSKDKTKEKRLIRAISQWKNAQQPQ